MSEFDYEVLVIGAGPGGYETAIRSAQLGKKTCIVEREYFGGTCLNVGCIPTKTLIKTADVLASVKDARIFAIEGVDKAALKVDMEKLQKRKNTVIKRLTTGVETLLKANGCDIIIGEASFVDEHTVSVGDKRVTAADIIIATGSSTFIPPFIAVEGDNNLLTSTEALCLTELPGAVAVIGGGVIGIEFAFLLSRLGCKVTVIELMDHILPMVDREISDMALKRLKKDGVKFFLGAKVSKIKDNEVFFECDGKEQSVSADAVLMAVGRVANTEGLNAEAIGIKFDKRNIAVDGNMRTSIPNIYAVGDVNGKVMLAHTASAEGEVALSAIMGEEESIDYDKIPSCIYLEPEIASIGLSEERARELGDIKVGKFTMMGNGKSLAEGDTSGAVKVILAPDGTILGAHLYGLHVTDMIAEISLAMNAGLKAQDIIDTIHPHPTVSEAVREAFMAAWRGKAINGL